MRRLGRGTAAVLLAAVLSVGCGSQKDLPLAQLDTERYVTLGDYRNLSVTVEKPKVEDTEVVQTMLNLYRRGISAELGGITDRAVAEGDTVNIDYVGTMNGEPFENGSAAGTQLTIGSDSFIDGFEDGLIGSMPGETVALNLTFPDPYLNNPDLSGQAVVFTVTVNYILPPLESEADLLGEVAAAAGVEEVSTVQELRQYAYDSLNQNAQSQYENNVRNAIIQELLAQCDFKKLPENMLEQSRQTLTENLEQAAAQLGISAEDFAYFNGMSISDFVETYAPDSVKQNLALQAVANKEGLNVGDEELQTRLEDYAAKNGYASVEELLDGASQEDLRNYFMAVKVLEFLTDHTKVN